MVLSSPKGLKEKLRKLEREAEERDARRRAAAMGFSYKDLATTSVEIDALRLIPEEEARRVQVAGLALKGKKLAFAFYNPKDGEAKKLLKKFEDEKYAVSVFVASLSSLAHAWSFYKYVTKEVGGITGKVKIDAARFAAFREKLKNIKDTAATLKDALEANEFSTTELFEAILAGALSSRASDIHFEVGEEKSKIRYRVDGLLHDVYVDIRPEPHRLLTSRIKLLSGLKINVRDEAQDGRFTIGLGAKEIEVRVSVIPSEFGETVVMRLLDPDTIKLTLSDLGLRADDSEVAEGELGKPNGLILNTGPTGSGKSTTLYAFLQHVNDPETKIITIEDPIEYHLEGIEQTQVDSDAGYTFASGLRSILRQDPDIILVGEIRDQETAEIAMHAALTGHVVLSTLHTNDAVGAIPRLVDIGIKTTVVGPALSLVIAQRLVRRLCLDCKTPAPLSADIKAKVKKFLDQLPKRVRRAPYENPQVYKPEGCAKCNDLGYKGRVAVFEFLVVTPELEELINKEASEVVIKKFANEQGMVHMQEDGILKVLLGVTTFKEVEEATGTIMWGGE
ncbi:MAG: GspE/PulE family protein [bacterium]|nr:GspE/PulE family protein [bacterium]